MQYPLQLRFKILAIASQVYVTEPGGNVVFYVKQKAFKLKEDITVFADEAQSRPLFHIKADRIIDFSANYHFTAANGQPVGSIKRQGMKSLWKAHYDVAGPDGSTMLTISEENPWVKVLDAVLSEVPVVGMFVGYVLHPAYIVTSSSGQVVMRLKKKRSLIERHFEIDKLAELHPHDEARAVLGALMMLLLERTRG
jgi:uncharacterized protein YxjI